MSGDGASWSIRVDDVRGGQVIQMLREHLESMKLYSPPESIHALDLPALRRPEITFWCVWEDRELLGCGAIKELDARHAEIKSMRTVERQRRRGFAAHLMQHILLEARRRGFRRLSLETGSAQGFAAARALYERFGFHYCEPFADYVLDPYSVFMSREL